MEKVSVLLSVYNPNKDYLIKQLESINAQTYKNIELLIYDDCPNSRCDKRIFKETLTRVNYKFLKYNKKNVGYSKAFQILIENVEHNGYIAFCDQDDIWLENKIEEMVKELKKTNKEFAYCDRNEIDENDNLINSNIVNPLVKDFGDDRKKLLIGSPFRTLAQGMSIICSVSFAKSCIPFENFAFDKWLSCVALAENKAIHIKKSLVNYRRHNNNVSGILNGITSKKDYYSNRVYNHDLIVKKIIKKYPEIDLKLMDEYSTARIKKHIILLFKNRWINKNVTLFEILLALTPDFLFKFLLFLYRRKEG